MDSSTAEDLGAAEVTSSNSTILINDDEIMEIACPVERRSAIPHVSNQDIVHHNEPRKSAYESSDNDGPSSQPSVRSQDEQTLGMSPEQTLQAYLIRQQLMVGIHPEDIIPMRGQRKGQPAVKRTNKHTLLRITNDGITVPHIPPAQFTGTIQPFPVNAVLARPLARTLGENPKPDSLAQVPYPDRKLPPLPIESPVIPVIPLKKLGIQRHRSHDIPRIADFASIPRPGPNTLLPSIHSFLQGVAIGETAQTTSSGASNNGSDGNPASPPPVMDGGFEVISTTSTENRTSSPGINTIVRATEDRPPFLESFLDRPELSLKMTDYLDMNDIINLMATVKPFNIFMTTYQATVIVHKAKMEAPESAHIFPAACYPSLCNAHRHSARDLCGTSPSLRWLSMVLYREAVVNQIMRIMDVEGQPLPLPCRSVIKKFWFIMDIPDNERRRWTVQNVNLWQDIEIFYAVFFLVRIDLLLRTKFDNRTGGLRRLIMAQPSLSFLLNVLEDKALHTQLNTMQSFVRWQYRPEPHECEWSVFGVPSEEVGLLQYEGYGRRTERTTRFTSPDDYILAEFNRRELNSERVYVDIISYQERKAYCNGSEENRTWVEEVRLAAQSMQAAMWLKADQVSLEY